MRDAVGQTVALHFCTVNLFITRRVTGQRQSWGVPWKSRTAARLKLINQIAAYVECMKWIIELRVFGQHGRIEMNDRVIDARVSAVDVGANTSTISRRVRCSSCWGRVHFAAGLVKAIHNPSNNKLITCSATLNQSLAYRYTRTSNISRCPPSAGTGAHILTLEATKEVIIQHQDF